MMRDVRGLVVVLCLAGLGATLWWARAAERRRRAYESMDAADTSAIIEALRRRS